MKYYYLVLIHLIQILLAFALYIRMHRLRFCFEKIQ